MYVLAAHWHPLHCLLQTTGRGCAPDVWLQLLEVCAAEPRCQPTALRSLAQQLAQQKAATAQQLQQGTLIAEQQQQLAALQQVVVEQGAHYQALIAGLQGQLQELRAELQQLRQHQPH